MGCDIHAYIEDRHYGSWYVVALVDLERDYELFHYLAGVRSGDQAMGPVARPKGLPEDVSQQVLRASKDWGEDAHSRSWLSLAELEQADQRYGHDDGYHSHELRAVIAFMKVMDEAGQDTRLVFWFDN